MKYNIKKGPKLKLNFRPYCIDKIIEIFKINDLRDFQIAIFKCSTFIFFIVLATYIAIKIT